jgi:hypothetical protein
MDLLDFARGPALSMAVAVFLLGSAWRLANALRRPRRPDLSPPREGAPSDAAAAGRAIVRGLWPRRGVARAHRGQALNAYVYHVGLALVVFGYAPHIAFVRRTLGVGWPALPDMAMYLAAGTTFVSLLLAWFRLSDRSGADLECRRLGQLGRDLPADVHWHGGPDRGHRRASSPTGPLFAARSRCIC